MPRILKNKQDQGHCAVTLHRTSIARYVQLEQRARVKLEGMKLLSARGRDVRAQQRHCVCGLVFLLAFASLLAGCSAQLQAQSRRYHLVGKVVSVDQSQGILLVDHQAIPGYMDAMTMPYPVPDTAALAALGAGDEITADVVVTAAGGRLENIVVTKKATGPAPPAPSRTHEPQPGDRVPDFTLTDQDGKRIHLSAYRGHVLLLTFIYTRCPFPNYCPLVSRDFAQIYAATRSATAPSSGIRLLSVSFDPQHDTPAALRSYAATFSQITGALPFDRWEFATAPPDELRKMADFFGLYFDSESGLIVHSMSTSVISPQGEIYKWYSDNDWSPADLIADAAKASAPQGTAAAGSGAGIPKN
jgi:protein SCO1/2